MKTLKSLFLNAFLVGAIIFSANLASAQFNSQGSFSPFAIFGDIIKGKNSSWNLDMQDGSVSADFMQFDLTPVSPTQGEGKMVWNEDDGTLNLGLPGGNVNLQIGQELLAPRAKAVDSNIDNGQLVYVSGADGIRPEMTLAQADSSSNSRGTIAMSTEDITQNQLGYFTAFGLVRDIDTGSFAEGDILYLSASVAGGYTNVKPSPPSFVVKVGTVIRAHATEGSILVNINQRTNNFIHIRGMTAGSIPFADSNGFLDEDNSNLFWDDANNRLGIGTATPGAPLHVVGTSGLFKLQDVETDSVLKNSRIVGGHYLAAEEPVGFLYATSSATTNRLTFGGGSSIMNAATDINFNTAGDSTTTTGTIRMVIDRTGNVGIGQLTPGARLDINTGATTTVGQIIQGVASQSADLLQFKDSADTVLTKVTSTGRLLLTSGTVEDPAIAFVENDDTGFTYSSGSIVMTREGAELVRYGPAVIGYTFPLYNLVNASGFRINNTAGTNNPVYVFRSDTDTGIGQGSAEDTLVLFTNDIERMRVDENGNVGIETTSPNSKLEVNGSVSKAIVSKTSAYTASIDDHTILCDSSGGVFTITLPATSGIEGRVYVIKKTDSSANAVTIDGNAAEAIDGDATFDLEYEDEVVRIQTDGSNWFII